MVCASFLQQLPCRAPRRGVCRRCRRGAGALQPTIAPAAMRCSQAHAEVTRHSQTHDHTATVKACSTLLLAPCSAGRVGGGASERVGRFPRARIGPAVRLATFSRPRRNHGSRPGSANELGQRRPGRRGPDAGLERAVGRFDQAVSHLDQRRRAGSARAAAHCWRARVPAGRPPPPPPAAYEPARPARVQGPQAPAGWGVWVGGPRPHGHHGADRGRTGGAGRPAAGCSEPALQLLQRCPGGAAPPAS